MSSEAKKKRSKRKPTSVKSAQKVRDYGNDPFFVKKAEDAAAFLEKHGFPEVLVLKLKK